jgi:multidrug efflux pump
VVATGAGSEMRHAMGVAVFAGMLGVTLFGLFLTPVFFVTIETLFGSKHKPEEPQKATPAVAAPDSAGAQENA